MTPAPETAAPQAPGASPDDQVPPAPVERPEASEEVLAFARAIAKSANAELTLSSASFVRALVFGLMTLGAAGLAWLTAMVALTVWLVGAVGAVWAFAALAVAHGALATVAWHRRRVWQKRIGFARTRAALATIAGLREAPP